MVDPELISMMMSNLLMVLIFFAGYYVNKGE